MKDITSTITKPLAVLGENGKGYTKEAQLHFLERQCRQAGHPRVASKPRTLRQGYHAHGGQGQEPL